MLKEKEQRFHYLSIPTSLQENSFLAYCYFNCYCFRKTSSCQVKMCAQTLPSSLVVRSSSYISIQWRRLSISIFISTPLLAIDGLKKAHKKGEKWIYWAFKTIEFKMVSVPILYILTNFQILFTDILVQFYSFFCLSRIRLVSSILHHISCTAHTIRRCNMF